MRFIVTGGNGFVGRFLISKLCNLYPKIEIHNLDISANNIKSNNFINTRIDLTNKDEVSRYKFQEDDIVFHLAANVFNDQTPYFTKRREFFENLNVNGTRNLLQSLKKNKVSRIAFISTCMVYGNPQTKLIKTSHPLNPNGPYGLSKVKAEKLINEFGQESGNKSLIFRAGLIAGPGRLGLLKKLSFLIENNLPVPMIGSGKNRYQLISVYDCVNALIKFIELDFPSGTYNLGSKEPPIVKDLLKTLITSSQSKSFLVPTWPYGLKKILFLLDILNLPLLYPEQYLLAQHEFVLDISDLENDLGFIPKYNDKDILYESYMSHIK